MVTFICDIEKPRLLFILVAEHNTKYSDVIVPAVKLKLTPDVYHYNCSEHVDEHSTNLYNTWFTDLMMKKGNNKVVVVTHDENEEMMMEIFDARMHNFHSIYNHMFVSIDLRPFSSGDYDEVILDDITHNFMQKLWSTYATIHLGGLSCTKIYEIKSLIKIKKWKGDSEHTQQEEYLE